MGDLNRLIIYGLLLAAPLLAVIRVLSRSSAASSKEKEEAAAKVPTPAGRSFASGRASKLTGVIGLWRWTPSTQLLTIGPEGSHAGRRHPRRRDDAG